MTDGDAARPFTVLVVEDDPVVRRALERGLASEPRLAAREARILTASDGRKAMALIKESAPDVVVTDMFMPRMDGFTLCRALRADASTEMLPIVVTSGVYKDAELVADLTAEVAASFVGKPIDVAELTDTILHLANRATRGTLRGHPVVPEQRPSDPMAAGSIAERGVGDLLLRHLEAGSTGTLLLVRGQMRKELFLREGRTVSAESNLRQETLGMLLVHKGVIDEEQLGFLLAETKRNQTKMGEVLVNLGWLSPEDVLKYLASQARRRIVDALRWTEGSYSFLAGDDFSERVLEHDLDVLKLVFVGLARTAVADDAVDRLSLEQARHLITTDRLDRYREPFEAAFGTGLLPLLVGNEAAVVADVLARPEGAQHAAAIEALLLTGLVELGSPSAAQSAERPAPGDSFSLERLHGTQMGASALRPSALPELLDDFDEGMHAGIEAGAAARDAAPHELLVADSEAVTLGPSSTAAVSSHGSTADDDRQAVLREYLRVHARSLYEVLRVDRNASRDAIVAAHASVAARFAIGRVDEASLGPAEATKLASIRALYERALRLLCDPTLRKGYDEALRNRREDGDALGAELAFHQGLSALADERFDEARAQFEQAIALRADQAVYHAFLGWAYHRASRGQDAARARAELERAIALDARQADAHTFLGRLTLEAGDEEAARRELALALEIDPTREDALVELVRLHDASSEHHATERLYRRMIHALGESALPLRRRLWKSLAELYETEFENRASARIAYEVAARLAPDDLTLQQKVVELNQEDPARWRELSRALAAEWRLRPEHIELGASLMDLYLRVGQHDAATLAASALVLRGSSSSEAHALAEAHRPRLLPRIARALPSDVMAAVRHPSEDDDLEALFFVLADEGLLPPFSDADLGVLAEDEIARDALPATFARVLKYVCHVLQAPEPTRVCRSIALGTDARIADARPHPLLVGSSLLESTDTVELGFRLARALSFSNPGRIAGSARPGRELRPYLLAGMAVARRTLTSEARVDAGLIATFEDARPVVRHRIADLGARLLRERAAISLSAWARSMNRTATRMGLVVSADLLRVGRAVSEEEGPEAVEDLLEFALSPEHVELRERLGLAAVV